MKLKTRILTILIALFSPISLLGQTLPISGLSSLVADTTKLIEEVTIYDYDSEWLPSTALRFEWSDDLDTLTMREYTRVAGSWIYDLWTETLIYGNPGLIGFNLIEDDYQSECSIEWNEDFVSQITCTDNQGDEEIYSIELLEGCYYIDVDDGMNSYTKASLCLQEDYTRVILASSSGEPYSLYNYFTTDLGDLSDIVFKEILDITLNLLFLDYEEYTYSNQQWILYQEGYLEPYEGQEWDYRYVLDSYETSGQVTSSAFNFLDLDNNGYILSWDNIGFDGSTYSPNERYVFTYSTLITSNEQKRLFPTSISLSQNYPNPFNPSTQIRFESNQAGIVKLDVFDILGRHIQTLVNGYTPAGSHSVTFDASGLPSGLYLYRLNTAEYSQAKTMHLLK